MPSRERSSYIPSILKEAYRSITRNAIVSTAAAISIIAALLILGIFIIFTANVNTLTKATEENLQVQIFLKDGLTQEQKDLLEEDLKSYPGVTEVIYESKEEALENFAESINDYTGLLDNYTDQNNPLPESFIVYADSAERLAEVRDKTSEYTNEVEYVRYQDSYITAIMRFTRFINILSIVLLIIMSIISFFLIYNTIRLTVVNQRKEIEIMKSLGATNSFIRTPFVLEGTFLGLVAAIISILLTCLVYYYIIGYLNGSIFFAFQNILVSPGSLLFLIMTCFIIYGLSIGSIGAVVALHKYLDI